MAIIKVEKLTFAYPGSDNIFNNISFSRINWQKWYPEKVHCSNYY